MMQFCGKRSHVWDFKTEFVEGRVNSVLERVNSVEGRVNSVLEGVSSVVGRESKPFDDAKNKNQGETTKN